MNFEIVREGRRSLRYECYLPSPTEYCTGTVAECSCGRRWKLIRIGWSFKGWRRTTLTALVDLVRGSSVQCWAAVKRGPHD